MRQHGITHRPHDWATEILLILPVFFIYQIGTYQTDLRNGVDFLSTLLLRLRHATKLGFVLFGLIVLGAAIVLYVYARRRERFQIRRVGRVLVESVIYALVMGSVIVLIMVKLLGMSDPSLATPALATGEKRDAWMIVYLSAGAGFHEEVIFRLGLFGAIMWGMLRRTTVRPFWILMIAMGISSVIFSAAHHIPPYGEPFRMFPFVFRVLAGAIFAFIFYYRGLATAVYTHFLYDVWVMAWHGA